MSNKLSFLKDFDKTVDGMDGVGRSSQPPRFWIDTGNHVLNKIISGSFKRGIPQGRITTLAGPSASGKSFLTGNLIREAQKSGAFVLVVDSENALDDDFVSAIGANPHEDYEYVGVTTIGQAQKIVSSFIKGYRKEYGSDKEAPNVLVVIDSLSMLLTDTELDNYSKGVQKGDQGQRNKQLKAMLRAFVQDIKDLNIAIVTTTQVYKNQDLLNGEGNWIVSDAVRYSASQIVLLTKLKLRDTGAKDVAGIRMKCEGFKTRFTKPFQTVTIEVPYDTGMDPYNGLLEVAKELNVIEQKGSWYQFGEDKFQSKNFDERAEDVLNACEAKRELFLEALVDDVDLDLSEGPSSKSKRQEKVEKE